MYSANFSAVAWLSLLFGTSSPITDMFAASEDPVICGPTPVFSAICGAFSWTIVRKFGPDGKSATRPAW